MHNQSIDLQNLDCEKCGLCKLRKNVVNGKGSLNAKIFLVGEWPGSPEDKEGDLFAGSIWEEVRRILHKADIDYSEVFLSTVVRCLPKAPPPDTVRDPSKEETTFCADYLDQEISTIKPNVIVPMGTLAVRRILGKVTTIRSTRGSEIWSDEYNCKVIPVYHPLMLKRMPQYEGFTVEDFRRIKKSAQYTELTTKKLGQYVVIDTLNKFNQLVEKLNNVDVFSYDTETNGLDFIKGKVLCVSFTWKEGTGVTLPITRYNGRKEKLVEYVKRKAKKKVNGKIVDMGYKEIPKEKIVVIDEYYDYWGNDQLYVIQKLKEIFANNVIKIAHNGKFDNEFLLHCLGITVNKFNFDTMLAHHLFDENAEGMHGLKDCAWAYTDMGGYEEPLENWFKEKRIPPKKRNYAHLPTDILYIYAAMDTDVCFRLYTQFKPRIEEEHLHSLLSRLVMPLSETLMEAELVGVLLDKQKMDEADIKVKTEIAQRETELHAKVGVRVDDKGNVASYNFNSNDQMGELLYKKLKLPIIATTETGKPSCNEATLTELSKQHEIPKLVLDYREVNNLYNKYIEGLRERVDDNYVIHSSFLIHGTVTGRLSCVPLNSEILTQRGWKTYNQLIIGEDVMGFDILENKYRWTKLLDVHKGHDTVGIIKTNHGHGKVKGILCTANHKWIAIRDKIIGFAESSTFPRKTHLLLQPTSNMPSPIQSFLTSDEAALFGWYLTDGFLTGKKQFGLGINLVKKQSCIILENLLKNIKHTVHSYLMKNNPHRYIYSYHISCKVFNSIYLKAISLSPSELILSLSEEAKKAMFLAMLEADGSMRHNKKRYDRFGALISQKKNTKEYFELLSLSLGQAFTFREVPELKNKKHNRRPFVNYQLFADKKPLYANKNHDWKPLYETDVWCPQTDCGTWVIRQGNEIAITGNSSDPNLQNIPKDLIAGINIKDFFIARPGYKWVEADYAAAEFRFWANYSNDQDMIRDIIAADNGTAPDIHKKTASITYKVPIDQVTKKQRDDAKRCVFGIMYGRRAESIAEQLGIPVIEAQAIIDQFLARYPVARSWLNYAILVTRKDRQISSIFGRIRRLPGINSPINYVREEHERLAMNFPIQSAASDMNCNAANRIRLAFKKNNIDGGIRILVHDAIYCEISEKDLDRGIQIMREEMERPIKGITVPMRAEVSVGSGWGDVKAYEFNKELATK